jgi:hypothetical protein
MSASLRHQRGLYEDYQWRVAGPPNALIAAHPQEQEQAIAVVALMPDGYRVGKLRNSIWELSATSSEDELSLAVSGDERWIERAGRESRLISNKPGRTEIHSADSPVVLSDGKRLAYLREDHGRAQVWVRDLQDEDGEDMAITPKELNVLEMTFVPGGGLIFSADAAGRTGMFEIDLAGNTSRMSGTEARYPAASPDGKWLAFSELEGGNWKLWLRSLEDGTSRRLTTAQCNAMEPAWAADSKTLLYASDCGRGLWFTAICRRRVVP